MATGGAARSVEARQAAAGQLLGSIAHRNAAARFERRDEGMLVTVPISPPRWLVPPLSWIIRLSPWRRVQLDAPGTEVLDLCDGRRTVEQVIEMFASAHKLSFREGQVAVSAFLGELLRRGIIVIAGQ